MTLTEMIARVELIMSNLYMDAPSDYADLMRAILANLKAQAREQAREPRGCVRGFSKGCDDMLCPICEAGIWKTKGETP